MFFYVLGLQDLPLTWVCKYGYLCLYINSEKNLRLYAASQKSSDDKVRLYCFRCNRRNCFHVSSEVSNEEFSNKFEFEIDNDFLEDHDIPKKFPSDLISYEKYPCKIKL